VKHPLATLAVLLSLCGAVAAGVTLATSSHHGAQSTPKPPAQAGQRPAKHAAPPPPAPSTAAGPHDAPVPILMYHVLGVPPANAPYPDLYVRPADLAGQLSWLASHGYHGVTLGQVFRYWRSGAALPAKPVVISFDDGYLSDYAVALPALHRFGWPGVLNLIVDNVKPGDLTRWQVRKLIAAGWEIDAHTVHHLDVTTLDAAQLHEEVAGSRADLQRMFGQPVDFFCYPAGRYDATAIAAVRAAGYLGATTTTLGLAHARDAYTLNRIRIDYGDGVSGFVAKLRRYAG
jgi:peptidoglycan/xylan/chitin deacetylase (PgdA/CDA1 family)